MTYGIPRRRRLRTLGLVMDDHSSSAMGETLILTPCDTREAGNASGLQETAVIWHAYV